MLGQTGSYRAPQNVPVWLVGSKAAWLFPDLPSPVPLTHVFSCKVVSGVQGKVDLS